MKNLSPKHTLKPVGAALVVAALTMTATPSIGRNDAAVTTPDDVRAEVSEAMRAIADYTVQERDEALSEARDALDRLDSEIERRDQALRDNWAKMSEAARERARERLRDLRAARNELGERFGALQTGTRSAWEELKDGFADSWDAFSDAWKAADG